MDKWSKAASATYKRWRDPELRGEENFVDHNDEDQGTDSTAASARVAPKRRKSASRSKSKTNEIFTVENALEVIGFGKFQWKICLLTGLTWIGLAMTMTFLSILGPQLHCEWRLPSYDVALITSVVFIGMMISSPLWGNLSDKYGRRVGMTVCMCWTLYYIILSAFAPVYSWLLFLNGLVGFGLGGAPQTATLYSEFLPVKARGTCLVLISVFWAFGAVLEVLLALVIMPTLGWRWLLSLSAIPMAIYICFCWWLPESPRFDILVGNAEKAVATLTRTAKENGKTMPQGKLTAYKQNGRGQIKDLFTPQYRRTTLLLWFIWFAYAFSYYGICLLTTQLFQAGDSCGATQGAEVEPSCNLECKYLTADDYKDLLWTTLSEFPGLLIILAVDHIGRKKTMALCFFMFSLCILPLYACIGRIAITIFIFIARTFISGGFHIVYIYTPEVFPTENRALAMGTSGTFSNWGSLITPFVAQVMLRTSVYLTLSIYLCCSLLAGVACFILPFETMGRGLQESSLDQEAGEQKTTTANHSNGGSHSLDQGYSSLE